MFKEKIKELGYDESYLRIQPIQPLIPTNMDKVINFIDDIKFTGGKAVILWDVDVDGMFSGYIAYNFLKEFIPKESIDNYVNETKVHGITKAFIRYCEKNNLTHVIIVDAGTNDVEEISYLNSKGIKVLVIDHHVKSKEYHNNNFVLVNTHDLPFGQNVSGAYITNEVMKQLHLHYYKTHLRNYDEMAVISIVADVCDRDDIYNKNAILHFICGKFKPIELVNLFRTSYTKNTISFIVGMTSTLNAIIRFYGSRILMGLLLNDFNRLASMIKNKRVIKSENNDIVLEIIRKSKIFEMSNLLVVVLADELPDKGVIIRNYLGIIASKLANTHRKMCLVLGNKKINYENAEEDYKFCFSARDCYKRNSLSIAVGSGIEGEGHEEAWGGYLHDDYVTKLESFNRGLEKAKVEEKELVIPVNNIYEFLRDIKDISAPFSLWNSIISEENKIKVEFDLVGQIVTQNRIKKILYKDYVFKSFEDNLSLNDKVHLVMDFNGDVEYLVRKV